MITYEIKLNLPWGKPTLTLIGISFETIGRFRYTTCSGCAFLDPSKPRVFEEESNQAYYL
jgi:hypothetical protein